MASSRLKLRIDPPAKFSGKENYEEFAKRLRNYMCLSNLRFADLMKWSITKTERIDSDVMQRK